MKCVDRVINHADRQRHRFQRSFDILIVRVKSVTAKICAIKTYISLIQSFSCILSIGKTDCPTHVRFNRPKYDYSFSYKKDQQVSLVKRKDKDICYVFRRQAPSSRYLNLTESTSGYLYKSRKGLLEVYYCFFSFYARTKTYSFIWFWRSKYEMKAESFAFLALLIFTNDAPYWKRLQSKTCHFVSSPQRF